MEGLKEGRKKKAGGCVSRRAGSHHCHFFFPPTPPRSPGNMCAVCVSRRRDNYGTTYPYPAALPFNSNYLSICRSRLSICVEDSLDLGVVGYLTVPVTDSYSVCLSGCPVHPSVDLSCLSVRPSISISVCLSVRPSGHLSVCPSVHQDIFVGRG